jgi:hypothetical protein
MQIDEGKCLRVVARSPIRVVSELWKKMAPLQNGTMERGVCGLGDPGACAGILRTSFRVLATRENVL